MISVSILTAAYNDLSGALRQLPYFRGASAVSLDKSRQSRVAPKLGEMALAERQRGLDVFVETCRGASHCDGVCVPTKRLHIMVSPIMASPIVGRRCQYVAK